MSARARWLSACICFYLLGVAGFAIINYRHETRQALEALDQRLEAAASAVTAITGEEIHFGEPPEEHVYKELVLKLSHVADSSGVDYIYSMVKRDGNIYFTSCSATAEELRENSYSAFMDHYVEASGGLHEVFRTSKPGYEIYTDQWGTFKSVFIPVVTKDGSLFVVGADMSIAFLESIARQSLLRSLLSSGAFVLLVMPLFVALRGFALQDKRNLGRQIAAATAEITELNHSLEARVADARQEADRARTATEQARLAKEQAESAKRDGMLAAANRLEDSVAVISQSSEELDRQISRSAKGTNVQTGRIGEIVSTAGRVSGNVAEVAQSAGRASGTTEAARRKALEGADVVAEVVRSVDTLRSQSNTLKAEMGGLGAKAEGISKILDVISDIADQTNLLALNAAIEAARAGEAGRGFAVVADEVRKLAEKTMQATREVGEAIKGIQDGVRQNVGNVERSVATIQDVASLAGKSGATLGEIVTLVDNASEQVRTIVTTSQEQAAASEEIRRSIEEVDAVSTDTAEAMAQAALAVSDLASQAQTLARLVKDLQSEK